MGGPGRAWPATCTIGDLAKVGAQVGRGAGRAEGGAQAHRHRRSAVRSATGCARCCAGGAAARACQKLNASSSSSALAAAPEGRRAPMTWTWWRFRSCCRTATRFSSWTGWSSCEPGEAPGRLQERHHQRAVLQRPLPRAPGDAGRADPRGARAGAAPSSRYKSASARPHRAASVYLMSIDDAKFRRPVVPGDRLDAARSRCCATRGRCGRPAAWRRSTGRWCAEAEFLATIVKSDSPRRARP